MQIWENDKDAYLMLLNGAAAAYGQNELVKKLLGGAIARLARIADIDGSELMETVSEIVSMP